MYERVGVYYVDIVLHIIACILFWLSSKWWLSSLYYIIVQYLVFRYISCPCAFGSDASNTFQKRNVITLDRFKRIDILSYYLGNIVQYTSTDNYGNDNLLLFMIFYHIYHNSILFL